MNRLVITKRVKGKGMVYTNPCPRTSIRVDFFVGNPRTCAEDKCGYFRKLLTNREGKLCVHCECLKTNKLSINNDKR